MPDRRTLPVFLSGFPVARLLVAILIAGASATLSFAAERPNNLAVEARVSASGQSSDACAATMAVDAVPLTGAELDAMTIPPEEKTPQALALRRDLVEGRFGFRDILLVKRKPLDISHVYVYHVEGYRPGGGLYVFTPDDSGGRLKCIFDAGQGMITTADLSYDGREIVFALRRGGHVASNPMAHIEDISRYPDEDCRRVYLWMDLNIPYYGTSSSNHKAELGSRRMYPVDLDATLSEVASRRCATCHQDGVPRKFYTRALEPEKNSFLLAPLVEHAGGTQRCGQPVFTSTADPDYQRILRTFDPIRALLQQRPRADMREFAAICEEQVSQP